MADQRTIKEYIRALEHTIGFLRTLLEEEKTLPSAPTEERTLISELTELRMLAKSDSWPLAVPEDMICGEDEDHKNARAAGIIHDFMRIDLSGKKLLDFGCGEGHVPYIAASLIGTKLALGYDLINQNWDRFSKTPALVYTTQWQQVKDAGPYDVILLNDVLDHSDNPKDILEKLREVKMAETGKVFVRCHPWSSRHGTHAYKQLNRAYLHLVFTEDEMATLGVTEMKATKLLDPVTTYHRLIKEAGFTILKEDIITHPVELFFTHKPAILRRIREKWNNGEFPRAAMEVQFVDYVLV